jgi:malate/lactate dehydrogenase-like protein
MPAPYDKHRAQLKAILTCWGMPDDNAEATADILSWTDLHGVGSHGISMLPGYDRLRRSGSANMERGPASLRRRRFLHWWRQLFGGHRLAIAKLAALPRIRRETMGSGPGPPKPPVSSSCSDALT